MEIALSYSGNVHDLKQLLQQSEFEEVISPILKRLAIGNSFTIIPQRRVKATSHTKGRLKFIAHSPHGVVASFHPANEANDGNIQFLISGPRSLNPHEFLAKLREFQMVEERKREREKMENQSNTTSVSWKSIYDNQDSLSLVVTGLQEKAVELGSQFLTQKTARDTVSQLLRVDTFKAEEVLKDLTQGEILVRKGNGPATTYAVVEENKKNPHEDEKVQDAVRLIQSVDETVAKVNLGKLRIQNLTRDMTEYSNEITSLENEFAALSTKLEDRKQRVQDKNTEIFEIEKYLSDAETLRILELARLLGKL